MTAPLAAGPHLRDTHPTRALVVAIPIKTDLDSPMSVVVHINFFAILSAARDNFCRLRTVNEGLGRHDRRPKRVVFGQEFVIALIGMVADGRDALARPVKVG